MFQDYNIYNGLVPAPLADKEELTFVLLFTQTKEFCC